MPDFPVDVLTPTTRVFDAVQNRLNAMVGWTEVKRAYVTVGDIDTPTDCSQLVASARQVYAGVPGQPNPGPVQPFAGPMRLTLEIGLQYSRCWTSVTGQGVTAATKETAQATTLLSETSAFLTALLTAWSEHELVDACDDIAIGPTAWFGPEGGVAGIRTLISLQLV